MSLHAARADGRAYIPYTAGPRAAIARPELIVGQGTMSSSGGTVAGRRRRAPREEVCPRKRTERSAVSARDPPDCAAIGAWPEPMTGNLRVAEIGRVNTATSQARCEPEALPVRPQAASAAMTGSSVRPGV